MSPSRTSYLHSARLTFLFVTLLLAAALSLPAASVPEPRPAKTDYLVGAFYFPGWKGETHQPGYGWAKIVPFPDRTPLLGYYDEGSPEVADWEIKWALEHGIRYFVYCWYRNRDNVGRPVTVRDLRLGHAIHEGLFKAKYGSRFQFAIMWADATGVASADDLLQNLLPFWINDYFKRPNYLKVDRKPVLFVYDPERVVKQLGGVEKVRAALDQVHAICQEQGFAGLLVLCRTSRADPELTARNRDCGCDAQFAYTMNHPKERRPSPQDAIAQQIDTIKASERDDILPFVPTATMGWDPMPWQKPNGPAGLRPETMTRWRLAPEQFQSLIEQVKALMDDLPSGSLGRRMLLLDNWNEWGEGHFIAPHAGAGFGYLRAVREVFTRRDNRPDYRSPYDLGLGPYDSLYRSHAKAQQR